MLSFTDNARKKILEAMETEGKDDLGLRITIEGSGPSGVQYGLELIGPEEVKEADRTIDAGDFKVYLDAEAAPRMDSATVDFLETLNETGFKVEGADEPSAWDDDPRAQKVQKVIEERINPGVASHGGWVELLGVKDDTVFLKLGGGCQGCGMVDVTLKQGIEVMLKEEIPDIARVIDQTDHAGGQNPYYQPSKG